MRASSKVFRMKSMGPAGSPTLYAGIGPVDKQVYDCKALNSLPKQLYRAVPVGLNELVVLKRKVVD